MISITMLRNTAKILERRWKIRPYIVAACIGGTDEHWQFFHPIHNTMPYGSIKLDGQWSGHPDSPVDFYGNQVK